MSKTRLLFIVRLLPLDPLTASSIRASLNQHLVPSLTPRASAMSTCHANPADKREAHEMICAAEAAE
jgi:hypothetical protein